MSPFARGIEAAEGFLDLGMFGDAFEELQRLKSKHRRRTRALRLYFRIWSKWRRWPQVRETAATLSYRLPEEPEWIAEQAFAVRRYSRTEDGLLILIRAIERFPKVAYLHYQLAAYENRFGRPHYARKHLVEAIRLDRQFGELALNEPYYFGSLKDEIGAMLGGNSDNRSDGDMGQA